MLTFMFAGQGGSQIYSQTLAYTWGQAPGVRNATTGGCDQDVDP